MARLGLEKKMLTFRRVGVFLRLYIGRKIKKDEKKMEKVCPKTAFNRFY